MESPEYYGLLSNMATAASNLTWTHKSPFLHCPKTFHSHMVPNSLHSHMVPKPPAPQVQSPSELVVARFGSHGCLASPRIFSFRGLVEECQGEPHVAQPCLQPRQGDKYLRWPGSSALVLPNIVHAVVGFCPGKWFHVLPRWYFVRHSQSFGVESLFRNTCFREVASALFIGQSLGPHGFWCAGPRKHRLACYLEIQPGHLTIPQGLEGP